LSCAHHLLSVSILTDTSPGIADDVSAARVSTLAAACITPRSPTQACASASLTLNCTHATVRLWDVLTPCFDSASWACIPALGVTVEAEAPRCWTARCNRPPLLAARARIPFRFLSLLLLVVRFPPILCHDIVSMWLTRHVWLLCSMPMIYCQGATALGVSNLAGMPFTRACFVSHPGVRKPDHDKVQCCRGVYSFKVLQGFTPAKSEYI